MRCSLSVQKRRWTRAGAQHLDLHLLRVAGCGLLLVVVVVVVATNGSPPQSLPSLCKPNGESSSILIRGTRPAVQGTATTVTCAQYKQHSTPLPLVEAEEVGTATRGVTGAEYQNGDEKGARAGARGAAGDGRSVDGIGSACCSSVRANKCRRKLSTSSGGTEGCRPDTWQGRETVH